MLKLKGAYLTVFIFLIVIFAGCPLEPKNTPIPQPNPTPNATQEWVAGLFAASSRRGAFTLISAQEFTGGTYDGIEVLVAFAYPDIYGADAEARAKLFIPAALKNDATKKAAYFHFAGYNVSEAAKNACMNNGVIISTPCGDAIGKELPNPLIRGENIDVAILHRVRSLRIVEDSQVLITGASAGGYMTLMLAAETFPLLMVLPDYPPLNLSYNFSYFYKNRELASENSTAMPIFSQIAPLSLLVEPILGSGRETQIYLNASPIVRMQGITAPTLMCITTSDLLVPINQYLASNSEFIKPYQSSAFPAGFKIRYDDILTDDNMKKRLVDVVPEANIHIGYVDPNTKAAPFAAGKLFTVAIVNEGAPEPQIGHYKSMVEVDKGAFMGHYIANPITVDQLTAQKLERLMKRYQQIEAYPQEKLHNGKTIILNRLDYPEIEKADVIRSLKTYITLSAVSANPYACAENLQRLYKAIPQELQALGTDFADGTTQDMLNRLNALH